MKQDFLDAVSSLVGRLMEDSIHTSAPSKVGKVENNHTAKLTPNLKVTTDDGREVPYPEISGTIILMPCGAGGTVGFAFPVKSDDGCLALFNEGGSGTDLKWDLSNAALLPGLYQSPGEQVKKAGSEEAAIMFAPSSTITVTKDKIEIKKDDTKITVTDDSIKMEKGSTTVTASSSSVDVTSPSLNIKGNTKVSGNIWRGYVCPVHQLTGGDSMADARSGAELTDYSKVAFSVGGVRQEISIDDWRNGWAAIVGGLNGKPTSQQFNMVFYILSVLLNQNISDVSAVKNTANAALPKESFTAKQIVAQLSQYGLMSGCDADMLDGKHAAAFALSKHSHAASDITSGNLPIERGGTGAGTAADACRALGAMRNTGGTFTGTVYFANGTAHYVGSAGDAHFKSLTASEDIHAKRVFEAVYNDYAELMPRGEQTDPGDIIALDTNSQQEKYVKATNLSSRIAGIHSDEYGMLIGGEQVNDGEDFLEKNLPLFIPVSLAGRVHTKVVGPVSTGDCIVLSHIPGVGRAAKPCEYIDPCKVVGYAVEGDNLTEQRRLKVRVRGA